MTAPFPAPFPVGAHAGASRSAPAAGPRADCLARGPAPGSLTRRPVRPSSPVGRRGFSGAAP